MTSAIILLVLTYAFGFIVGWTSKALYDLVKVAKLLQQQQKPEQPACPPHDWAADKGRLVCQKCKQVAIDLE